MLISNLAIIEDWFVLGVDVQGFKREPSMKFKGQSTK